MNNYHSKPIETEPEKKKSYEKRHAKICKKVTAINLSQTLHQSELQQKRTKQTHKIYEIS